MHRSIRFGLAAAAVLLAAALGGYTAYWFVAAGRLESGIMLWARSMRAHKLDLSWRAVRVDGFPFCFRVTLDDVHLHDAAFSPAVAASAPRLVGRARPWDFRRWRVAMPDGVSADTGQAATLTARSAKGAVAVSDAAGTTIALTLDAPAVAAGLRVAARAAALRLSLPPHPPRTHTDRALGLGLDVHALTLPAAPAPLRSPVDEVSLDAAVMGPILDAPPRQAAAAWRDAGGTVELDRLAVRWNGLAVTGSGTAALDSDLQPIGGFSGTVEGYDRLMAALVAAGRMRPGDAQLARLALSLLARPGPDGRPALSTSFAIQDGEMYLGPVKLGRAPHIAWP